MPPEIPEMTNKLEQAGFVDCGGSPFKVRKCDIKNQLVATQPGGLFEPQAQPGPRFCRTQVLLIRQLRSHT